MEFSKIQEKLSERCSNCFCELAPSKNDIPLKVEGEEIRVQNAEVEDNLLWSTENSEFNVFEAVTFIHRWTTEEFTDSLLAVLKPEYSQTTESFPFFLSVCATCKPILLQLFRLHQEFNQLSNELSIISRIRQFNENKYDSLLSRHVKAELFDNSDADGIDSFLSESQDFSDTNLLNRNDDVELQTHGHEIPARLQRTTAQKSKVARPMKKRGVNVSKKKKQADDINTFCKDVSVAIPRLAESLVKAYSSRSVRRKIKKEIPDTKLFESENEDSENSDIVPRQQNYKKGSKNKSLQKYTCDRCDRKFRTRQLIDMHKRMHVRQDLKKARPKIARGPGPFKCPHCPKLLTNYDNFIRLHLRAHETDLSVICDVCGKRYSNKHKLKIHKRFAHPEEGSAPKKPSCPICGKSVRILREHMKLHDKERESFKCEQCEKSFKTKLSWQDHVEWAHSGQKFICATCGKEFQTKGNLSAHERIHSDGKRHPCEICQKTFRNPSSLESHFATHSDARPYLCNLCGKDFKRRNQFGLHMEGHKSKDLGTAVFPCSQCGQTFKNRRTRARHIKSIHADSSKQILHSCPTCSKSFRESYNLKVHRRSVHKEDV